MKYIVLRLAIAAAAVVWLNGATAVWRPVAPAEMVKRHEAMPEAKAHLKDEGVSEEQLRALKKELEPGETERHAHYPCDDFRTRAAVEQCKKLRAAFSSSPK